MNSVPPQRLTKVMATLKPFSTSSQYFEGDRKMLSFSRQVIFLQSRMYRKICPLRSNYPLSSGGEERQIKLHRQPIRSHSALYFVKGGLVGLCGHLERFLKLQFRCRWRSRRRCCIVQSWPKKFILGCVPSPRARGGFTQPRTNFFCHLCTGHPAYCDTGWCDKTQQNT